MGGVVEEVMCKREVAGLNPIGCGARDVMRKMHESRLASGPSP